MGYFMKSIMRIKDIVNYIDENDITIEYRTYTPDGYDILTGYCRWNGMQLIPLDGDTYSLNDEIIKYKISIGRNDKILLTIWQ